MQESLQILEKEEQKSFGVGIIEYDMGQAL